MIKKYIIEIAEIPYMNGRTNSAKLYKAKGFSSLVFDEEGLSRLEPLDDACKNCLDKGDADEAYQQGLDDAWNAARKIALPHEMGGYTWDELNECFGKRQHFYELVGDYTAAEAVEKIRAYEESKTQEDAEIKVGDEVKNKDNVVGVAFRVNDNDVSLICNSECGYVLRFCYKYRLTKTGRHVDLTKLFGGEDE